MVAHTPTDDPNRPVWDNSTFEVKIANGICDRLNVTCRFVPVAAQRLGEREEVLQTGTVDVVVARFSVTAARSRVVNFVQPYYFSTSSTLYVRGGWARAADLRGSFPADLSSEEVVLRATAGSSVCYREGWYRLPPQ